MATPRQAAALASSSSARSRGSSSGWVEEEEDRPQSGRKAKTKVDWGDVEAKAKSEAMWLLNWRKQQAAHAATHPAKQQKPPRKRGRKAASPKAAAAATTTTVTPGTDADVDSPRQKQGKQQEKWQGQEPEQRPGQEGSGDKAVVRAVVTVAVPAEEPSSASTELLTSAKPSAAMGPAASAGLSTSATPLALGQPSTPAMPLASRQPSTSFQPSSSTSTETPSPALLLNPTKSLASEELLSLPIPSTSAAPTTLLPKDLSTPPPTDFSTSPPTDLSPPTSTDLSTPTPMDISTPTPIGVSPPSLTDLSTPTSTVLSTPAGPSAPPTPLPSSPEKVQSTPPAPAPATGSALAAMEVEVTAPTAETTTETSSPRMKLAAPSDQVLTLERNSSAAVEQAGGLSSGEPAPAGLTEVVAAAAEAEAAVLVEASVVVGTLTAATPCLSAAVKSELPRPTPVGAALEEGGDAGTEAESLATAEQFGERRIGHPPPPRPGSVPRVKSLVVPPLAPTVARPLEPPSVEEVGPGEAVRHPMLSMAVESGSGAGRGGRGGVDFRVVAKGTGSSPSGAVEAERCPGGSYQGMCLLAVVAARRALEEAELLTQQRRCGGQGHGRGLSPHPSCQPGVSSTGVPSSSLPVTLTAPPGGKRPRDGASPNPAKQGSASGKSRKRARPQRLSGSEPLGTPLDTLARATTAVEGAAPRREDAMDVECRRVTPLPWRPRELRFIVDGNKAVDVGTGEVPPPLALPPAPPLQLPLSAAAPAGVRGAAGNLAGVQGGHEGKTPGVEAFWLQGLPKMPGFPAASSNKGDAENAGGGQDREEGATPGLQAEAPGFADRAPAVLGVTEGSGSPMLKGGGLGRKSSFDSSASTARESLSSSPACSSVASAAGGEGDLGLLDAVRASSPVPVSPLASPGTAPSSDGGGGGDYGSAGGGRGVGGGRGRGWGWGWDKGQFSLRWLPPEGLAAVHGAGASCGMDRAALDAAADAAAAAEEAAAVDATVAAEHAATGSLYLSHEKAQEQYNATAAASAAAVAAAVAANLEGYAGGGDGPRVVRRKAKRKPRKKRETHVLVSESEGEDGPSNATSLWAGVEEKAKAEAKALLSYRNSGMVEAEGDCNQHWVRRSVRAAGASALDSAHVVKLLEQIRMNDPEVEVLKLHHYLGPDVNTAVIDAVLEALTVNTNCQALYIQNFNEGFRDEQVAALVNVLRRGNIWCLNAGENYKVSLPTWWEFVEEMKSTNVTHAYLSEHVITPELKNAMRKAIRDNRVKHTRHKQSSNLEVIRRCTNMWWNPINSKDLQRELKIIDASYQGMPPMVPPPMGERFLPCSLHPQGKQDGMAPIVPSPVAERLPCSLHAKAKQEAPPQPPPQDPQQQPQQQQQQQQLLLQQRYLQHQLLLRPGERPPTPDRTDCPHRAPCVFRQC